MRPREEKNVPGQPALPARWPSSIDSCSGIGNSKLSPVDKETHLVISDDTVSAEKDKRRANRPSVQRLTKGPPMLFPVLSDTQQAPPPITHPLWPATWTPADSALSGKPVTSNASVSKNFLIQPGGPELLLPFAPSSFHLLPHLRHPMLPWDSPAGPWLWEALPQTPYPGDYLPSYK